ncbi:hypothetical protein MUP77_01165 [Candidatus Bathyarchaeota archaeon]|nr:hypothetical protein [Candidatus Bathyarchaeota archaeon]
MSFNDVMIGVAIGVTTAVIATGITFYIKDYLKERAKFRKFKEKFEQIAGKNAKVLIPNVGQVKIVDINKQGIVVESQLRKTFIPIDKVFQTEISLPVENYEKLSKELLVKTTKESFDLIFPLIMDAMKEMVVKEFIDTDSQVNAVMILQLKTQLKNMGYEVSDKLGEITPSLKQISDHYEKKGKSEKTESPK